MASESKSVFRRKGGKGKGYRSIVLKPENGAIMR